MLQRRKFKKLQIILRSMLWCISVLNRCTSIETIVLKWNSARHYKLRQCKTKTGQEAFVQFRFFHLIWFSERFLPSMSSISFWYKFFIDGKRKNKIIDVNSNLFLWYVVKRLVVKVLCNTFDSKLEIAKAKFWSMCKKNFIQIHFWINALIKSSHGVIKKVSTVFLRIQRLSEKMIFLKFIDEISGFTTL